MDNNFWQQRWMNNNIKFNQDQPNDFLITYFPGLNLSSQAKVLVPLCGKSIDMLWLADQGYQVIGIELSLKACEAFFAENKLSVKVSQQQDFTIFQSEAITLFCGDFFQLSKAHIGEITAVYDRAALVALPDELRRLYAQQIISLLSRDNQPQMLLITAAYNQKEMAGPPFSVDYQEVVRLYSTDLAIEQLHQEMAKDIPEHLADKGLTQSEHLVFKLSRLKSIS